jgi:DNA-binding transcriptional regulator YhcF (GntR family)
MERNNRKFGIVYQEVVSDPELCLQAKGLYALICTYANKERTCFPSIDTLADVCDVNPSTIHRNLNKLKEKGYIKRIGRKFLVV